MKSYSERVQDIQHKLVVRKRRRIVVATSVGLAAVLALNLTLFVPYTTGSFPLDGYRSNAYYPLIEQLSALLYPAPVTANNFERWGLNDLVGRDELNGGVAMPGSSDTPGSSDMSGSAGDRPLTDDRYEEVTDNQTEGIIEGDLIKRSTSTLFRFGYRMDSDITVLTLSAYSIAKNDSQLISAIELPQDDVSFRGYTNDREMFLSEDLSTVTLILPCFSYKLKEAFTAIYTVNVEDPATMSVMSVQYLSGRYLTSRSVEGNLLIVSNFVPKQRADFDRPEDFVPHYGTLEAPQPLPMEDILLPEEVTAARYTVLVSLDPIKGEIVDAQALLSFSQEVYVSETNIYATHVSFDHDTYDLRSHLVNGVWETTELTYAITLTEFTRIAYEGGMFEVKASKTLKGALKDRFCMDEYNGVFRTVLTTDNKRTVSEGSGTYDLLTDNASLYLLDAESMEEIASLENFAPDGESVQSARFSGTRAYVCTALTPTFTDPVYLFDLSDPQTLTGKDTGTIPGYSIFLRTFFNDTLLGIGYNEQGGIKIEVYGEGQSTVEPITAYESLREIPATDSKAYFVRAEDGLVGLGIQNFDTAKGSLIQYLLLQFDGYSIREVLRVDITEDVLCSEDELRAFCDDGWIYIVSDTLEAYPLP